MRWFIRRAKRRYQRTDYEWALAGLRGAFEVQQETIGEALKPTVQRFIDMARAVVARSQLRDTTS